MIDKAFRKATVEVSKKLNPTAAALRWPRLVYICLMAWSTAVLTCHAAAADRKAEAVVDSEKIDADSENSRNVISIRDVSMRALARKITHFEMKKQIAAHGRILAEGPIVVYEGNQQDIVFIDTPSDIANSLGSEMTTAEAGIQNRSIVSARAVFYSDSDELSAGESLSDIEKYLELRHPPKTVELTSSGIYLLREGFLAEAGEEWIVNHKIPDDQVKGHSVASAIDLLQTRYGLSPSGLAYHRDKAGERELPPLSEGSTVRDLLLSILIVSSEAHPMPLAYQIQPKGMRFDATDLSDETEIRGWQVVALVLHPEMVTP